MNNDESQTFLSEALGRLAQVDPSIPDDARLTEWYVIAVHETDSGPVFSRYTAADQSDWTDMGLLRLASTLDERELGDADV